MEQTPARTFKTNYKGACINSLQKYADPSNSADRIVKYERTFLYKTYLPKQVLDNPSLR